VSLQSPRDRLIDTAAELFCRRGLPNVGINEVTDHAGVARMTLYNNFASKEDLALAAFERQVERRRIMIDEQLERCKSVVRKIEGLFAVALRLALDTNFRGCAFINVAAQQADPTSRLHSLARAHKCWIKERIQALIASAGVRSSQQLAQQILALWDGAVIETYIQGTDEPILAARDAAVTLVKAATSQHSK
jgi:AcrR family transcriptional regulator